MGFTLSRVALLVCGAILMAAVAVPITDMFRDRGEDGISKVAEADAQFIDAVWNADLDETVLRGDVLLPSPSYGLVIEGYFLTISDDDGNRYTASLKHRADRIELGYGESVSVGRYGDRLMLSADVPETEPETDPLEGWTSEPPAEPPEEDEPEPSEETHHGNSFTTTNENGNSITISCGPA